MIGILMGMHSAFTKYCCFYWGTVVKQVGPQRGLYELGVSNIQRKSLIKPEKSLLAPLHINLVHIKQYVKILARKSSGSFAYAKSKFLKEDAFMDKRYSQGQ